ncbi:hypothetical protein GCM10007320_63310 [Pseudorhodoferax aquiterrae]|uniref:Uncharacterized protein n=1 Tax=Pseudorhodoferax aquiterrae TaxID=747304 RepID=A0ABQ3GFW0_9BURK|nr:hypothetical protein [Pseudorhodoferax aquiterrae]GHD03354.1 hypothetical protein GCM10007320_63310 [Pseudorhodoferax aquiterrae]
MYDFKWSDAEKRLARRVFELALKAELADIMAEFKARAAAAAEPDDMWSIEQHLHHKRREIEAKYDFRYSRLILLFAQLLREGRMQEEHLAGLADEKLSSIRRIASL